MEVAVRDGSFPQAGYASGLEALRALGVGAVEVAIDRESTVRSLTGDDPLFLRTDGDLARFGDELAKHGIRVCAFLCAQNFNAPEGAERDGQIEWVVQAVRAAEALGVPALRIDSIMSRQNELPLEERIAIYAAGVNEVLAATPESPVALGIENHGAQGNDPDWMRGVLEEVGHPRVGVTLDVGNWYWYGHPLSRLYEIYREFGPHVKATHVKNIRYPEDQREVQRPIGWEYGKYCCPLDEGDIDMRRVATILKEAGYDGALAIEDESIGKFPEGERAAVLKRDVEHLTEAIRARR
jgi:sugar phosphate isomerase/epimerase